MMKGLIVDQHSAKELPSPVIIFEDDTIIIVEKPSGMPSVPGLDGRTSLLEWLRASRHGSHDIFPVHRLDMDTSGVMIFAKTEKAAVNLQRQFEEHSIRKTYRARVTGEALSEQSDGEITLPLSPDYDERPRQKVDFTHGKDAVTRYHISCINPDNTADLILRPHTGRTHQLRVHCAHRLGLCSPILGDMLYGGHTYAPAAGRLCLHALSITFSHPDTDERMTFTSRQLSY
jgi:tRNA pseudouridine32 synthase/23S rRNA pseudouridine746 synthase